MTPREAMSLAIEEGKKGAGFASPNPLVGCVILDKEFGLIGKGYHARFGEGHAEVQALHSVEDPSRLEGAHFYVTLEPCAHEGRTPSCAKALAKLPIASVTYGLVDPYPLVSGKGVEILKQAGKTVTLFNDLRPELEELCEIFLLNQRRQRPFVALKAAVTLDGKIAHADGSSKWITSEPAREHVQYLRGCYDAVVAGAGTVLKDDPRLNSRDPHFVAKRQRVVIFDLEGKTLSNLASSSLLSVRPAEDVIVVTASVEKPTAPVQILRAEGQAGRFDLKDVLGKLSELGIKSLFVEGGALTYSAFLQAQLTDRLYLYVAPEIFGEGISWIGETSAGQLTQMRTQNFAPDVLITGRFTWSWYDSPPSRP